MSETANSPPPEDQPVRGWSPPMPSAGDGEVKAPPLRIHHIMLWTAVTAVILAVVRLLMRISGEEDAFAQNRLLAVMTVVYSALASGAIVVFGLGLHWRRRGYAFFDQPGQWLATETAIRALLIMLWLLLETTIEPRGATGEGVVILSFWLGVIGVAIFNVVIARYQPERSSWRLVFRVKATMLALLPVLLSLPFTSQPSLSAPITILAAYLPLVALQIAGTYSDRKHRIARHWTHWYGLPAHLGINVATACLFVAGFYYWG